MKGIYLIRAACATLLLCFGAVLTKAGPELISESIERCYSEHLTRHAERAAPQDLLISLSHTNATCHGSNTGTASVVATGAAPFTYLWSNGKTTSSVLNLVAGTYGVSVIDANGDLAWETFTIGQPDPIVVYANCVATCPGVCAGSATLTVSGGVAPYSFMWSNGATSQSVSGLCAAVYWVTITDANGCVKIKGLVVSETQGNIGVPGNVTIASCISPCCGSIDITPSGTGPFSYAWSNGATMQDLNNLCPGTYSVTVTSTSGCGGTATFNVGGASPLAVNATITDATACTINCDGSISLSVTGGVAPYAFVWSTGQTSASVTDLCFGTYNVTITDAAGCTLFDNTTIFNISCVPIDTCFLEVTVQTTSYPCDSVCTGTAMAIVSMQYPVTGLLWSNGATTYDVDNLCAGAYSVTVTTQDGCTAAASGLVECEPAVVPCNMFAAAMSYPDSNCGDGVCDGTVVLEITGTAMPYVVMWHTGQVGDTLANACPGLYSVSITDALGCTAQMAIQVSCTVVDTCYPIIFTPVVSDDSNCSDGICDGSIDLQITGGTQPYTVLWSNGAMGAMVSNLCSGHYTYTIIDAAGCVDGDIAEVECIDVVPCDWFTVPLVQSDSDCSDNLCDGAIYLQVIGADSALFMGSYTIEWSNGMSGELNFDICPGVYGYTVTDGICTVIDSLHIGCVPPLCADFSYTLEIIPDSDCNDQMCDGTAIVLPTGGTAPYTFMSADFDSTGVATDICAGYGYWGAVLDAAGCVLDVTIFIPCNVPCELFIGDIDTQPSACNGTVCNGQINIMTSGGTSPLVYAWSNGSTTQDISGLCPGIYELVVTDSQGCTASSGSIVIECQSGTCLLEVQVEAVFNDGCNGAVCTGLVSLWVSNAVMPVTYNWSNGATSATATDLCAGVYGFTVADAFGCIVIDSVEVGCDPLPCEITGPVATIEVIDNTMCGTSLPCTGAIIIAPFDSDSLTFVWDNGATTNVLSNLCAGNYTVTITDTAGCTLEITNSVACVSACPLVFTTSIVHDGLCDDMLCQGSITVDVITGTAPYTYEWSNGATGATAMNLCNGIYTVTVTDADGCMTSSEFLVIECEPAECVMTVDLEAVFNDDCSDANCTGLVSLWVSNAVMPLTYNWSNGDNGATASALCAGVYTYTVTDNTGCIVEGSIEIACDPVIDCDGFMIQNFVSNDSCDGTPCEGSIVITVSGGTGPYVYGWSNGATGAAATGLCAGDYQLTVMDAMGCQLSNTLTVACSTECFIPVTLSTAGTLCAGGSGITISVDESLLYEAASFEWTTGSTLSSIMVTQSGVYAVSVMSSEGCTGTAAYEATETFEGFMIETMEISCPGDCDGVAFVWFDEFNGPYTYLWNTTETTAGVMGLCAGEYCVTITDATGCVAVDCVMLEQPATVNVEITTIPDTDCDDAICDGIAMIDVSGGTAPYTYLWSNGSTINVASGICPYVFLQQVSVFDANGCIYDYQYLMSCLVEASLPEHNDNGGANASFIGEPVINVNPNPFNEQTSISFSLPHDDVAKLDVFDMTGRLLATLYNGNADAYQSYTFDFNCVRGNGLYLYRLTTSRETLTGFILQMK